MVFAATLAFAKRRPLTFAIGFGGVKTIAADAFVQKYMEHADAYDQKRLLVFLTFGFFQVGFVQYNVYVNLFSRLFPAGASFTAAPIAAKLADGQGLRNLAKQVFIDQCVYHPCCYFPVFYTCKEIIDTGTVTNRTLPDAMSKYVPNAADDLKALWSIFLPTSIVQFSVMPMHLRVPFVATVGFFWCGILSMMRGGEAVALPAPPVVATKASTVPS